ncbi:MAG: class I SAM-dependent methyltransferase [Bacteroidota bacterium]
MKVDWKKKWNERYRESDYAYGEAPNLYLKDQLGKFKPGKILFPAEGEGRNAVFAAKNGWEASAFDFSKEAKKKAIKLAEKNNVSINYQVGELPNLNYEQEFFDAVALVYAHFPPENKSHYHQILSGLLKKGGVVIFEAFGKNHLEFREKNPKVGGPRNLASLFSIEEIKSDFKNYDIVELMEVVIELKEGRCHNGIGSVTRFVGIKK